MTASRRIMPTSACAVILLLLASFQVAAGFSWRGEQKPGSPSRGRRLDTSSHAASASQLLQSGSRLPSIYEVALRELEQLESEPLCHRTAATLLVNNCQLLQGKDEATILTDSGRQIRDFVDAYAASLAICDLERGGFTIPSECNSFREQAIGQLALTNTAHLHVTSKEIDQCLSGLGTSDSAWNTWISYRHKALRFCEAARADNDKAQNIQLFQRLTKILGKLADGVDERIAKRMADLDNMTRVASDRIDRLSPQLDSLRNGISTIEEIVSTNLAQALKQSADTVNAGTENALNLQKMLEVMMKGVIIANAEAASAHEDALSLINRRAESEMAAVMNMMAATFASASALQNQIELSNNQVARLERQQEYLEHGLQRLIGITDDLSGRYDDHSQLLYRAQNVTNDILDTLGDTAASASIMGNAFLKQTSVTSWWPYIWCPAASLVMGSYGLPPSALRNLGLVALGEVAGAIISSFQTKSCDMSWFSITTAYDFAASKIVNKAPSQANSSDAGAL